MKKTFKVVLGSRKFIRSETPGVLDYAPWTATTFVEVGARKQAVGAAYRNLGLDSSSSRVLRVEEHESLHSPDVCYGRVS